VNKDKRLKEIEKIRRELEALEKEGLKESADYQGLVNKLKKIERG
jgi:hypothetical protein